MKYVFLIIIFFSFISCDRQTDEISSKEVIQDSVRLYPEIKICDSCSSYLVITHNECTECSDLSTVSGTLNVPYSIYKRYDSIVKTDTILIHKIKSNKPVFVNLNDLKLFNGNLFNKLWSDTVNYSDFHKRYEVRGKVMGVHVRNGFVGISVLLNFRIDNYKLIPDEPNMDIKHQGGGPK